MSNAAAILKQFYDAVRRRDMHAARGFLADDMIFVGLFETYPNADAYILTFTQLMQIVVRLDVKALFGESENAAIFMEMVTSGPVNATTLVAEWHQVRNDKIVRAQSAFDGRPFAAMFASPSKDLRGDVCTYDILHSIETVAPVSRVYEALATKKGLAGWWTEQVAGEDAVGGTLQFRFDQYGANDMKVISLVPGRRVEWRCVQGAPEWIGTTVTFDLKDSNGKTKVLFAQRGWREQNEFMHYCSTKWAAYLIGLKALVETGRGAPYPHDTPISLRD